MFGPVEENSNDSVEEEEEEEEEPEEGQEKDDISSIFEEKREVKNDKPDYDPWRPLRPKVWQDLKELYWKEVQQFLDIGGVPNLCRECRFQCPITWMERKATKDLLRARKMDSPYETRHSTR